MPYQVEREAGGKPVAVHSKWVVILLEPEHKIGAGITFVQVEPGHKFGVVFPYEQVELEHRVEGKMSFGQEEPENGGGK